MLKEFRIDNTEDFKEGNEFGLEIFKDISEGKFKKSLSVISQVYIILINSFIMLIFIPPKHI